MGVEALVEWGVVGKVRKMMDGHGLVLKRRVFRGFVRN